MSIMALGVSLGAAVIPATALGAASEIFVTNLGSDTIGEYTTSGATVNADLISHASPFAIAVSGSDLFFVSGDGVHEYTTSGTLVNVFTLGSGTGDLPDQGAIVVSGSTLFAANTNDAKINEYTTSGTAVNASLVSDSQMSTSPGLALSGSDLFVAQVTTIGEYTTSGATVNAALVSGLNGATGIAVSGSDLFVENHNGVIGEYTTSGAVVNADLITLSNPGGPTAGGADPTAIAVSGSDLFIAYGGLYGAIGEFTTSGATVNAELVSGLNNPVGIAIEAAAGGTGGTPAVPLPPAAWSGLALLGGLATIAAARSRLRPVQR
jgi:hypothetical protein